MYILKRTYEVYKMALPSINRLRCFGYPWGFNTSDYSISVSGGSEFPRGFCHPRGYATFLDDAPSGAHQAMTPMYDYLNPETTPPKPFPRMYVSVGFSPAVVGPGVLPHGASRLVWPPSLNTPVVRLAWLQYYYNYIIIWAHCCATMVLALLVRFYLNGFRKSPVFISVKSKNFEDASGVSCLSETETVYVRWEWYITNKKYDNIKITPDGTSLSTW